MSDTKATTAILRPALTLLALLTGVTGVLYPLAVTGVARVAFPAQAAGGWVQRDGRVVGAALIGQPFSDPRDFWGRPSATAVAPYNALASGGANLGPTHPALVAGVQARIAALRQADPDAALPVPADLVTASASGLDPHISPAAARYQIPRIARARGIDARRLERLVAEHVRSPLFGDLLGEPRVNVLELNLALDALSPA
jgi:K+-transporting ATPase ATPase C chain